MEPAKLYELDDALLAKSLDVERAAAENGQAAANRDADGAYGPNSCVSGMVWREAVPGDRVCVTPERRSAVAAMR